MLTTYRRLISQTWKDQLWYNPCVHVGHVPQGGRLKCWDYRSCFIHLIKTTNVFF